MTRHPGGTGTTKRLLELGGLMNSAAAERMLHILDMGAGDGHSLRLLEQFGWNAVGIDLNPGIYPTRFPIICGNFLHCPFPDQTFDVILSECSFYISAAPAAALLEAFRLLKKGGLLLLADVSFYVEENHILSLSAAGFRVRKLENITALWKEYYISCIWDGTADALCPNPGKGPCSYYLTVCERM